ncbi:hypothetical protein [Butyrivibrio sp. FCS014]|uniref:hypothetical protein n=1 Tax=Butyrivibrio sp. FCS014 TaxID=1408304 RepID=UPI0012DDE1DB|nr:hypothetical protein [Butyrivibrio sp. FCS014]
MPYGCSVVRKSSLTKYLIFKKCNKNLCSFTVFILIVLLSLDEPIVVYDGT